MKVKYCLFLLTASIIWGLSYIFQSYGNIIDALFFNGLRFLLGALGLFPFVLNLLFKKNKKNISDSSSRNNCSFYTFLSPFVCGMVLGLGTGLQQIGIKYTKVGKAGFLSALYIIFVPLFKVFHKKRISKYLIYGICFAVWGLFLLCLDESFCFVKTDFYLIGSSICFALQILLIENYLRNQNEVVFTFIQFLGASFLNLLLSLLFEHPDYTSIQSVIVPLLYAGFLSCSIGFLLQVIAQKKISATISALILSMESVFSALFGWLILGDKLSGREIVGCMLVFIAIFIAQIPEKVTK